MKIIILFLSVLLFSEVSGQVKKYTIPPQEAVGSIITDKEAYIYSGFQKGMVHLANGTSSAGSLNYHSLYDEIHYISKRGDTLALSNESALDYVVILTDSFFYNEGFMKSIASARDLRLLKKQVITLAEKEKSTGGYGYSSTAGIESFNNIASRRIFKSLTSNEQLIFVSEPLFFFSAGDKILAATKSNLLSFFKSSKKQLESYLKENSINLKKEEDLVKLMQYIEKNL